MFETGFPLEKMNYGTYYDKVAKKEYIYMGVVETDKKRICFFDATGKKEFEIPLHVELAHLLWIEGVFVYQPDTVIVIDRYVKEPKIAYFNREGNYYSIIHIDSVYNTGTERYRPIPCMQNIKSPHLYMHYFWNWENIKEESDFQKEFPNKLEYVRAYMNKMHTVPQICMFDIQTQQLQVFPQNFSRLYFETDTSLYVSALLNVFFENDKLFISPHFNNKVLVYNPVVDKFIDTFRIISDYAKLLMPHYNIKEYWLNVYTSVDEYRIYGQLWNIIYDKNNHLYYAIVHHAMSEEDFWMEYTEERDFSIIIYDKNFNKLNEQYFSKDEFDYRYIFLSSQGLFISESGNSRDYDPTKCKFVVYEIEK
ncbi:MAG: DUF4221 domain-containing protein [Bacteroidales bacterium]|nr:DUF4221 domain-containing protein [Bacteroidales bacterium]